LLLCSLAHTHHPCQIHTPDSSRYWLADSYEARLAAGQEPQNIDKEFLRLWFRQRCDPYADKVSLSYGLLAFLLMGKQSD
jgi:phosphoribosylaminoimidazole-succinocarboxamide synthase